MRNKPWSYSQDRTLTIQRSLGVKLATIAKLMGRTYYAVSKRSGALGLTTKWRKHKRKKGSLERSFLKVYKPGLTDGDIGAILGGVTKHVVAVVRRRLGLPPGLSKHECAVRAGQISGTMRRMNSPRLAFMNHGLYPEVEAPRGKRVARHQ